MKCFFYPNRPIGHTINSTLGYLGWEVVKDPEEADLFFWWKFTAEHEDLPDVLRGKPCVNSGCVSTMKSEVERRFVSAFGVTTLVDPTKYLGDVVRKSEKNATHDGVVIGCPIEKAEEGFVYQRLLGDVNRPYNIRVPVIGGEVPYVSYQRKNHLFYGVIHGGVDSCEILKPGEVFSREWLDNLKLFAAGYIDIAEVDVVDDCILDVNNTPSVAAHYPPEKKEFCISSQANLIKKYFGK